MIRRRLLVFSAVLITVYASAAPDSAAPVELKHFALNSLRDVRAATNVTFGRRVFSDGHGSIRVDARETMVVPLFEVTDITIDDAALIYQASLQSEKLEGRAYLEMWVRLPGKGEFFSRGLDRPISGTTSWMKVATPFRLEAGQKPDLIRLNLVVQGRGRVWIDDVRLFRAPLP